MAPIVFESRISLNVIFVHKVYDKDLLTFIRILQLLTVGVQGTHNNFKGPGRQYEGPALSNEKVWYTVGFDDYFRAWIESVIMWTVVMIDGWNDRHSKRLLMRYRNNYYYYASHGT